MVAELPCIVARIVAAYATLRDAADAAGGLWKAVPPRVVVWQSRMAAATNKLHEFFTMDDDDRGCVIVRAHGHVTWLHDLESAFEAAIGSKFRIDPAVMSSFGFELSETRQNVCISCKQLSKKRCCPEYSQINRRAKHVVYNMRIDDVNS